MDTAQNGAPSLKRRSPNPRPQNQRKCTRFHLVRTFPSSRNLLPALVAMTRGGKREGAGHKSIYASPDARKQAALARRKLKRAKDREWAAWVAMQEGAILTATLPLTAGHLRAATTHSILHPPCKVKDLRGGTLLQCFRAAISTQLLLILHDSTEQLVKSFPPPSGKRGNRGDVRRYHMGYWRKYSNSTFQIKDTDHPASLSWIQANRSLFQLLGCIFLHFFPDLYSHYATVASSLPGPAFFTPWAAVSLNINFPALPHKDKHDHRHGFCWVVPFGSWEGGNLHMAELDQEVALTPGDVVCFQSTNITHHNSKYLGTRYSLVLFSHDALFFPSAASRSADC